MKHAFITYSDYFSEQNLVFLFLFFSLFIFLSMFRGKVIKEVVKALSRRRRNQNVESPR